MQRHNERQQEGHALGDNSDERRGEQDEVPDLLDEAPGEPNDEDVLWRGILDEVFLEEEGQEPLLEEIRLQEEQESLFLFDVVCGRGIGRYQRHEGNRFFHALVAARRDAYLHGGDNKRRLTLEVIDAVASRGGRFLLKDSWIERTLSQKIEKVQRAFVTTFRTRP